MITYVGAIIFGLFVVLLIVLLMIFVIYMNNWLCFKNANRILCLQNTYQELESIVSTKDESEIAESDHVDAALDDDISEVATMADEELLNPNVRGEQSNNGMDDVDNMVKKFGALVTKFNFDIMNNTLSIEILSIQNLPLKRHGGPSMYQLYAKIFTENGRTMKKWHSEMFKVRRDPTTKIFQSSFTNKQLLEYTEMSQKDVSTTAVRFRLYGCERKRRDKLLAESIVALVNINFAKSNQFRLRLEKRGEIKLVSTKEIEMEEDSYFTSAKHIRIQVDKPVGDNMELMVGLAYHNITGHLTVEIVKGNSLKNPSHPDIRLPNSFVKISLIATNQQVIAKSKTGIRENQSNPLFKEKFVFHVPLVQLPDISIVLAVYHKKNLHHKESIGWFSIGHHCTSDEEASHWKTMEVTSGQIIYQWHLLQQDSISKYVPPDVD